MRPRARSTTTKSFVARRPLAFCSLLSLVLFGLTAMSAIVLPRTVISSVEALSPELRLEPSDLERALTVLVSPENLFRVLAILLAVTLLGRLGWGHETGFNRPSRWRNLHLLLLPFLFVTLTLLGGIRFPGPAVLVAMLFAALLTAFSEELLYRGLIWRALLPTGLMRAVVATSVLSGVLLFCRLAFAGPWPEALLLMVLASCGSFTYAALRWRTASIWPGLLLHFVFAFANNVSALPLLMLVGALGFAIAF